MNTTFTLTVATPPTHVQVLSDGTVFKGPVLPAGATVVTDGPVDDMMTIVAFLSSSSSIDDAEPVVLGSLVHFG